MEANLGLNWRQGRSRFYGGGVGGLPPSAFEQLEECLFPKVISVSPCLVFHFSVRYRKYEATHGFLLVCTVIRNILSSGSLLDFTTASIHLVQCSGFIITRKKGNDALFGSTYSVPLPSNVPSFGSDHYPHNPLGCQKQPLHEMMR